MPNISGNAVAVTIAGPALVLAAGGTTYAVATSAVNIADPATPSRIATVDNSGHLVTTGSVSTIDAAGYLLGYSVDSWNYLTSPTTASLAVTRLRLSTQGTTRPSRSSWGSTRSAWTATGSAPRPPRPCSGPTTCRAAKSPTTPSARRSR